MTKKNVMKAIADANDKNKKRTIIAGASAGAASIITSAIVYAIGRLKNNEINEEIDNLKTNVDNIKTDITTLNTSVAVTENILAATTKAAATDKDTDTTSHVKYAPINIYEFTGAINNKVAIFTKTKSDDKVTFTALVNPTLEGYDFSKKYYVAEADYNKLHPTTEEKTEEKTDNKK